MPDICLTYDTIRIPDGGIWQYMQNYITVYGSTLWYIMMAVHFSVYHGLWQYIVHGGTLTGFALGGPGGGGAPADFGALLKALNCMHNQWQLLQVIACTNSFIHPLKGLPLTPLLRFGLPAAGSASAGTGSSWWDRRRRLTRGDPGPTGGSRNLSRRGGSVTEGFPAKQRLMIRASGRPQEF
jgi:hypothetical protein